METTPHSGQAPDSALAVTIGGLIAIVGLAVVVSMAIALGWLAAALVGVALLALAWRVRVSDQARVLRWVTAGAAVLALGGALLHLLQG
jgi:hypothetical protein